MREAIVELRAMVALERTLGLRAMGAIRSRDRLAIWEQQFADGQTAIEVVIGTKGGRPRLTHVPDPARALAAVREALAVLRSRGHLAPGTNGGRR